MIQNGRLVLLGSLAAMLLSATEAVRITAPEGNSLVVADRPYAVTWEDAPANTRFDVDLHYCGYSFCFEDDDCGVYLHSLCLDYSGECQPSSNGMSDVIFPEPVGDISGTGYRVRITEVGGGDSACSDEFYLMSSSDADFMEDWGDPFIAVVSPTKYSVAVAGQDFTVEFNYENCYGDNLERVKIDLYTEEGPGDCGGWVTSICNTPSEGCKDTQGDYDALIPRGTEEGTYKIRVGLFLDDLVYGCSEPFRILPADDELWRA